MKKCICCISLVVLFCTGCATIQSNKSDWDNDRACSVIKSDEYNTLNKLSGTITTNDIYCNNDGFSNIYYTGRTDITHPSLYTKQYKNYYSLRHINFNNINRVYSKPSSRAIILCVCLLGLGMFPDRDINVEMNDGSTYVIGEYTENGSYKNLFPFWVYRLLTPVKSNKGEAIDYMRQK